MALKAAPQSQAQLLELQALDTRLQQLDHQMAKMPQLATLTALRTDAERLLAQRRQETGRVDDARAELGRIESDVALVESRVKRDVDRLQGSSSVKDVAGLESELAGLRRRQAELEEIELTLMETLETLENGVAVTEAEHAEILDRVHAVEAERDAALEVLAATREQTALDRATIAAGLPADLLALYERQRQRYGTGASHLRGGVSSASGVKLLENEMAIIRSAADDDVLLCPDSDAILVRTEESGLFRPVEPR